MDSISFLLKDTKEKHTLRLIHTCFLTSSQKKLRRRNGGNSDLFIFFLKKWGKTAVVAFLGRICIEPFDQQGMVSVSYACSSADHVPFKFFFQVFYKTFLKHLQYLLRKEKFLIILEEESSSSRVLLPGPMHIITDLFKSLSCTDKHERCIHWVVLCMILSFIH